MLTREVLCTPVNAGQTHELLCTPRQQSWLATWIQMFMICTPGHITPLLWLSYIIYIKPGIYFHGKSQRGMCVFAFPLRVAAGLRSSVIDCASSFTLHECLSRQKQKWSLCGWMQTHTGSSHTLHSVISSA